MKITNKFLLKRFSLLCTYLLSAREQMLMQQIKKLPNVFIDKSFELDNTSFFNINGTLKKLSIAEEVECRRYCNFYLHQDADLTVSRNVFFNNYCSISCLGIIEIGENSIFGEGVKIYDHNHQYHTKEMKLVIERHAFTIGKVSIGKNCWIGSNVTILNNVTIGDNVIVGANCLVTKSIPSNTIVKANAELTIKMMDR